MSKSIQSRRTMLNVGLVALALAAMAGVQLFRGTTVGPTDAHAVTEQCPPGGVKDESAPWDLDSYGVITSICVKSGTQTYVFNSNGSDGCYEAHGIGTTHAWVTGGGTGRDCKAISHVVFYGGGEPSPSPEPSPEPSAAPVM